MQTVKPANRKELIAIIKETVMSNGFYCDLNFIDISLIDDLSFIFQDHAFNGDISQWDTSRIENMESMFEQSRFNGDISQWDVSKVHDVTYAFADSQFSGDLSKWSLPDAVLTHGTFVNSPLENNPPAWFNK